MLLHSSGVDSACRLSRRLRVAAGLSCGQLSSVILRIVKRCVPMPSAWCCVVRAALRLLEVGVAPGVAVVVVRSTG